MADNENDMTEGARDTENAASRRARDRAFGQNPLSTEQMAEAIAKASQRIREDEAKARIEPIPEHVRASVRCGYETIRETLGDGSARLVTRPKSIRFTPAETADGREHTVPHGRPVRLKRDAFLRYRDVGQVILAQ